jgi:hypothetical protein
MNPDEKRFGTRALHKYFIWAATMRDHFYRLVPQIAGNPRAERFAPEVVMADLYMSFWYGELYVVIEGWNELGLCDPAVDALLTSPKVDLLRRFRNGAFHFQRDYFDDRFLDFIGDAGTATWTADLTSAFGGYFLRWLEEERAANAAKLAEQK